jgi:hypothetical protein
VVAVVRGAVAEDDPPRVAADAGVCHTALLDCDHHYWSTDSESEEEEEEEAPVAVSVDCFVKFLKWALPQRGLRWTGYRKVTSNAR